MRSVLSGLASGPILLNLGSIEGGIKVQGTAPGAAGELLLFSDPSPHTPELPKICSIALGVEKSSRGMSSSFAMRRMFINATATECHLP